jgi:uncharacterized repeat protein (TIGR01451 family)
VQTNSASNIQATSASLNGYLSGLGGDNSVETWLQWGPTTSYGYETSHQSTYSTGSFSGLAYGLSQNTLYHFRAVVENNDGIVYGSDMTFTTTGNNISIQTNSATNVLQNQATLNGYFYGTSNNSANIWFQYGTTTSYGQDTSRQIFSNSSSLSQNITGLQTNTLYHYRAVAQDQNSSANVYGQDMTFTTQGITAQGSLTVSKNARNLSSGSLNWSAYISASPSDVLSFIITIKNNTNQTLNNITVKDIFPSNLIYKNALTIDNVQDSRDITSSINIGSLNQGQTKTITYQAQVAGSQNFNFGTTVMVNFVNVSSQETGSSPSAGVSISVTRSGVLGATSVSTGLTNNFLLDSFFLPLLVAFLGIWVSKSGIIGVTEWVDSRKAKHRNYMAGKELNKKIARIKAEENQNTWPVL